MEVNSILFNDNTKQICNCIFVSLFLIITFILSPLKTFYYLSTTIKLIVLILLGYSIYLNIIQTQQIYNLDKSKLNTDFVSQLNVNQIGNSLFTFFMIILFCFIIKSFF
jgi:hypothetical protein